MIDDKTLLAYADGELDPSRAADVERMLARDPALAGKLEQHRRLAGRLRASYDPVLKEPIPERLARTASGGAKVISLAEARAARAAKHPPLRDWRGGGLIAAGLAAALVLGEVLWAPHAGPVAERDGRLIASGEVARALDAQLSGGGQSSGKGGAIQVQLTFRDRAGAICRSFTGAVASGVACRQDGGWALKALFPGQGGDYRMAVSGDPHVQQIVGDMIRGDAFDAAQERAAKARHWISR
jgi:anti-sigma factor RsiW